MANRIPKSLTGPVIVERRDNETGLVAYEGMDLGSTYHCVFVVSEDQNDNAKAEAEFIALALNNAIGALRAIDANERPFSEKMAKRDRRIRQSKDFVRNKDE